MATAEPPVLTVVDAVVPGSREPELVAGFRALAAAEDQPPGLLRSELLRGQEGRWRIQTLWRDRAAVVALRQSGRPPAALELLRSVGAEHTHEVFTVEHSHRPG
jgi:heme-degrading monooxygenase HmoA